MATTRSAAAHRDEDIKEAMTEKIQHGIEQGKEALASTMHDGGDKLLALALTLHAAINFYQGSSLLWSPSTIVPGLFGIGEKLTQPASHTLVRCFGFQTLCMGLIALGAAWRYDTKHKAILNAVLFLFHSAMSVDLLWNQYGTAEKSGFSIAPGMFHYPMLIAHGAALAAYNSPDTFFGGGAGGGGRTGRSKRA